MKSCDAERAIDLILEHFDLKDFEGIGYEGSTPYQILVSTMLSLQTTERNSRRASEQLFAEYPTAEAVYRADPKRIEELVFCSGYYRQKTRNIVSATRMIVEEFGGDVPDNSEDLMRLPSVGKKTAACVLRYAYNKPSVIVDTHINRVSQRLGISDSKKPEETQRAIIETVPQNRWDDLDIAFITLGRTYCRPTNPNCDECPVSGLCRHCRDGERSEIVEADDVGPSLQE